MNDRDIHVHRGDTLSDGFFDHPEAWARHADPEGGESVEIRFRSGGIVVIHTVKPLLWIEPERH